VPLLNPIEEACPAFSDMVKYTKDDSLKQRQKKTAEV
jgi:hypothetical protein